MLRSAFRLGAHSRMGINLMITRSFSLRSGRRPVGIINDDEEEKSMIESISEANRRGRKKERASDVFRKSKVDGQYYVRSQVADEKETRSIEFQPDGKPRPPCMREFDDISLSRFMVTVKSRALRRKKNVALLEGKRLITDALLAGVQLKAVFTSKRFLIQSLPLPAYGYTLHWTPYKYFKKWSDVITPSGVLAFIEIPSVVDIAPDPNGLPLTIICDNIRDPGNMGSIIRVSAAVGCSKVLLTKGCVDIWESKVLRAGAGGHFRVPIEDDVDWENVNSRFGGETSVFLADIWHISGKNVADTRSSDLEESEGFDTSEENSDLLRNDTQETQMTVKDCKVLQSLAYHNVQFRTDTKNVLIISNESFGPSNEALDFTRDKNGVKIHIPLCGNVDSLNVVSAFSVIAFELKRQMYCAEQENKS